MNKQELIDYYEKSLKKLEYLQEEYQTHGELCRLIGKAEGIKIALQKTKELDESPDPIPLPTIKPGDGEILHARCPKCNRLNSVDLWDRATAQMFEPNPVVSIRGTDATTASFICPSCKNESEFCDLEVVE